MNITVYLGANEGNDPALKQAVWELGTWIGESGNDLIYGGSKVGLMGVIAESVLRAGGKVTGVEPQFFMEKELQYDAVTHLIVTETMAERKTKMIELGDVFVAMPGGTGTLEEISEVMSLLALDRLEAPCILYNLHGYYVTLTPQPCWRVELVFAQCRTSWVTPNYPLPKSTLMWTWRPERIM